MKLKSAAGSTSTRTTKVVIGQGQWLLESHSCGFVRPIYPLRASGGI